MATTTSAPPTTYTDYIELFVPNAPVITPPPGVLVDRIHGPDQAIYNLVTQAICITVITLMLAMRLFTKFAILKSASWDDYCTIPAWIGIVAYGALTIVADKAGHGKHLYDISLAGWIRSNYYIWIVTIIYCPVILFVKASILLLYMRIFERVRSSNLILHFVFWLNAVYYTAAMLIAIFGCRPIELVWRSYLPGSCVDRLKLQLASACINFVLDLIILVLPIASVWRLKTKRAGKVGLMVIFGFGIFACIASAARIYVLSISNWDAEGYWRLYPVVLWSTAELGCGFICGCISALPAFLRHVGGLKLVFVDSSNNSSSRMPRLARRPANLPISKHTTVTQKTGFRNDLESGRTHKSWSISSPVGPMVKNGSVAFEESSIATPLTEMHSPTHKAPSLDSQHRSSEWTPLESQSTAVLPSPTGFAAPRAPPSQQQSYRTLGQSPGIHAQ